MCLSSRDCTNNIIYFVCIKSSQIKCKEFNLLTSEFENIQALNDKMEPQYETTKDLSSYSELVNWAKTS